MYTCLFSSVILVPRVQAISGAVVASFVIAFIASKITVMGGERPETNTREWLAKNKIYMQHQKMNPIFGKSVNKFIDLCIETNVFIQILLYN